MSLAQHVPNFPTVIIDGDWDTAAEVLADIEANWGITFGAVNTYSIDVWEGPSDPDDYAQYTIAGGVLTIASPFASTPAAGTTVYIMDFFWS